MNVMEKESQYFFHTYKRINLEIEKGDGPYLIAKDGTRYLDMFGGIAVNALGYNHP
ncbi:MAG: aminotransferase class III-fold pyridoxal phosphate-dependent enzyme [Bacteroidota bacterium]